MPPQLLTLLSCCPLFGLLCLYTVGHARIVGTHGIPVLYARLCLSLPLEPARHMHTSEVSPTFPGQWEVCSGAPLLRRKPVLALPSRVCHWALTLELKQPLLLVVAGLTCGCLPSVTCTDAVVNAELSWVCDFLPKKERSGLSQSWQKRDIPLTPVS